jgi:linalool dehydratase/isomerase-like protein
VAEQNKLSRRGFVKSVAATAGAAALPGYGSAQAPPAPPAAPVAPLALRNVSTFPGLTARGAGWLRFLWEKATTRDDWSSAGIPHPWWDRYTAPVVLSYGRFDLSYSAYGLLLMADQTPAWREVYTRIADELASRYPTYWGAIDWFTQIGDDPKRANYPPPIMGQIPQALRGKYNRFGWTANGIEPWGLQPDPIGADGYLFFRAWFLLLLATYKYISGDDKWARPFKVTGYHDETFEWDTHRIAERLAAQYRAHPEGPQCENTKIWVFCNTAGGLGMHLYDKVFARNTHQAFENFIGYARENYIKLGTDGRLQSVTQYYDPIEKFHFGGPVAGGLSTAHLMLPQNRELGRLLYDAAANASGWRSASGEVRANTTGLVLAREMGDDVAYERLRAAAEREYEPKFFGEHQEHFGWFFNTREGFPRGQGSAMLMAAEIGGPGDWTRAFEAPHLDKYNAPTVEGIEFPSLGVSQAWNDQATGTLHVVTYAAAPDKRGAATRWRVTNLPSVASLTVRVNGQPFTRFAAVGPRTIELTSTIDAHQFEIVTGYRGDGTRAEVEPPVKPRTAAAASLLASTGSTDQPPGPNPFAISPGCPCCASGLA